MHIQKWLIASKRVLVKKRNRQIKDKNSQVGFEPITSITHQTEKRAFAAHEHLADTIPLLNTTNPLADNQSIIFPNSRLSPILLVPEHPGEVSIGGVLIERVVAD